MSVAIRQILRVRCLMALRLSGLRQSALVGRIRRVSVAIRRIPRRDCLMALRLSVLWLSAFCRPDKTRERRHPADSPQKVPDLAA
ncbi:MULTISPECIES: hypothetical protein [Citrobacter]|uniref:hypothetical protein n=1 Tax=Citrobacter TaxID=544 RepID=UPI0011B50815|nr:MULTISPECIES: hypothetical protein [Citrobacter]MBJ9140694.1 hypothetical protein [Citrobacter koseri]MBL4563756.1 hypothetical protein [Citrobacter koseri]MCK7561503.1 hypothetical protein [Citrobacter koseri]MDM2948055.1 hypothetical protein [Citrobacter sp. CK207]MDM2950649.1 hypothetical protein [Citrobacter sp. CK203]